MQKGHWPPSTESLADHKMDNSFTTEQFGACFYVFMQVLSSVNEFIVPFQQSWERAME